MVSACPDDRSSDGHEPRRCGRGGSSHRHRQGLGDERWTRADAGLDHVESDGVDTLARRGTEWVAEAPRILDLGAGLMDDGVVNQQTQRDGIRTQPDDLKGELVPQLARAPSGVAQQAVEGVVGAGVLGAPMKTTPVRPSAIALSNSGRTCCSLRTPLGNFSSGMPLCLAYRSTSCT